MAEPGVRGPGRELALQFGKAPPAEIQLGSRRLRADRPPSPAVWWVPLLGSVPASRDRAARYAGCGLPSMAYLDTIKYEEP